MSSSFKPSSIGYFLLLEQYSFSSILVDQSAKFLSQACPSSTSITSLVTLTHLKIILKRDLIYLHFLVTTHQT